MKPKHVLMLFTDQQRGDTIHALGNEDIVTPSLDSLANESIVFDKAYTPSPVCVPARLCMLSGQYCARTGNNNNNPLKVYNGEGFYSEFTKAGYNSCCIGKMHNYNDMYASLGFKKRISQEELSDDRDDYTNWLVNSPYKNVFDYGGQRSEMYYIPQVSQLPMEAHPTQWIGDRSVEFINNCNPDEPMFLVSSFIHPHPPFCPPAPWNKIYRTPIRRAHQPEDRDSYEDLLRNRYTLDAMGISPRLLETLIQHYYACISFVDYQIGRIIQALKDKGMYEDTIILFAADHGDLMGDFRSMGKRTMLDGASHIPFLLRVPGMSHEIRHDPASLVDIAPTLLKLSGIDYDPAEYDGVCLTEDKHDVVYSQYSTGPSSTYMVASSYDKLVYTGIGGRYFYFDSFPETKNKYDSENPRVAELKKLLDAHMASDACPEVNPTVIQSPARQEPLSFYPKLNDHSNRRDEEFARMPEGYTITLAEHEWDSSAIVAEK